MTTHCNWDIRFGAITGYTLGFYGCIYSRNLKDDCNMTLDMDDCYVPSLNRQCLAHARAERSGALAIVEPQNSAGTRCPKGGRCFANVLAHGMRSPITVVAAKGI